MKKTQKKNYLKPALEKIQLDKDISLVMMSLPPGDPGKSPDKGPGDNPDGGDLPSLPEEDSPFK